MSNWPHSPPHWLDGAGIYMITAATYLKQHFFKEPSLLSFLHESLLDTADKCDWRMQAWAVFSNHYHFVAQIEKAAALPDALGRLHALASAKANERDGTPGRMVLHQYWDTKLTFQRSWLTRLKYVTENPVKHGLVLRAIDYPYCSAGWLETRASKEFVRALKSVKIDRVNVLDDF